MISQHRIVPLASSLLLVFLFVVGINMASTVNVTAEKPKLQEDEGRFDPILGDQEEDEEWDEEEQEEQDQDEEDEEFEEDDDFQDEEEWDDEDEEDFDEEDLEREMIGMEFERNGIEINIGRLDVVGRLAEISQDPSAVASYAVMHLDEYLEPEESIDFLNELLESGEVSPAIKNLLKLKLVDLYAGSDQRDQAKKILKSLILGN